MSFENLRGYVNVLESNQELQRIRSEVDWNLEMGAITRRAMDLRAPAPLFEKIRDYGGFRVLGLPVGPSKPNLHSRIALALGESKDRPAKDLIEIYKSRLGKKISPRIVSDSACKENIMKGDQVDLLKFPSPFIHGIDGGRYIGTWHLCVTKSLNEDWVNWAIYRVMVHNKNTLGLNLHKKLQHGGQMYYNEYDRIGKPMPIAIAIGTDPVETISGDTPFPSLSDQPSLTGGIKGQPIKLVKCETVDLEVPASSEIVIEGEVPAGILMNEGPFGEFTGHTGSGTYPKPIIKVKCITYRNNPILTMSNMGKPWDDDAICTSITRSAMIEKTLQEAGLPVRSVFIYPAYLVVISCESKPGLVHKIVSTLKESKNRSLSYWTILVNEDVEPTDPVDVLWSMATRSNPHAGIHVESQSFINELYPLLSPDERSGRYSSRAYIDSTIPAEWSMEYKSEHCRVIDFRRAWPQEIQDKIVRNWSLYGYAE